MAALRADTPAHIASLMQRCWAQDPSARPSALAVAAETEGWHRVRGGGLREGVSRGVALQPFAPMPQASLLEAAAAADREEMRRRGGDPGPPRCRG